MEANAFKADWGATIFQTANEMLLNERLRERAAEVASHAATERAWWDDKRERVQRELLESSSSSTNSPTIPHATIVTPVNSGLSSPKSEDGVLVADDRNPPPTSPAPTLLRPHTPAGGNSRPQTPTTPGGRKKSKKGTPSKK